MTRQRVRRRIERRMAEQLGDDYKFTNDPVLAAERAENRRARKEAAQNQPDQAKWIVCAIRGCRGKALKTTSEVGPYVCLDHAATIWEIVENRDADPFLREVISAEIARRDQVRAERREVERISATKALREPGAIGDIYYVRVNGLVKVGWTSNLMGRLRQYGPTAELLVHYEATRQEETDLHHQLLPALAKGREWYTDGDIISLFLTNALADHGEPAFKFARWTTHDGAKTKVKRAR